MRVDIFELYEYLKKYFGDEYDDVFYDSTEGEAQFDIINEMLEKLKQ
jgi:hypothetical protein